MYRDLFGQAKFQWYVEKVIVLFFICLNGSTLWSAGPPNSILIRANPRTILANGVSTSDITAEIRDVNNNLVADGTEVQFSTTLGTITKVGRTQNGVARATLKSELRAGRAIVRATVGAVNDEISVEFASELGSSYETNPNITIEAEYLAYSLERRVIVGTGKVNLRYRGINIEAESLELDLWQERLKGQKNVKITSGNQKIEGDSLSYHLPSLQGILLKLDSGVIKFFFSGENLKVYSQTEEVPEGAFAPTDYENTRTWVVGKRMLIFPGERIYVRNASIWVGELQVLSLPNYVVSLSGYYPDYMPQIGYSSYEGLTVDFPFYYLVTDKDTGALRLRHQGRGGWRGLGFGNHSGWSLGIEHQYTRRGQAEGTIYVDGITQKDWSIGLQHRQEADPYTHSYFYLDYLGHRDLYARINAYKLAQTWDLSLEAFGSKLEGQKPSLNSQIWWRLRSSNLTGTALNYSLSANLSLSRSPWQEGWISEKGLGLEIFPADLYLWKNTILSSNLEYRYSWDNLDVRAKNFRAALYLRRSLSEQFYSTLGYSYGQYNSSYYSSPARRILSLSIYGASSPLWFCYAFGSYDLTDGTLSFYGNLSHRLAENWRLEVRSSFHQYREVKYNELEIYLGYQLGIPEARLGYSVSKKSLWLELAANRF